MRGRQAGGAARRWLGQMSRPHLTSRARASLACGLDALGGLSEAPLRVRGHASAAAHEVFDLQEEFELGPCGRRFILSVDPRAREALVVPLHARRSPA